MDPHDREVPMRILDCNQDAAKMNGLTLGTMIGRSIGMFDAAPLTYEQAQDKLTQLRAVGTLHGEGTHLHSDGHVFPIEYGCTLLHLNGREVLLGVDRDITERRKLDAEISEGRRLRAVGAMVGGIAHEFNNLLTPMLLYTEMLAKPSNSQEATLAYTRPLRQAIDQATNLTKRILTFGRRGTDERQRCDLAEVINDTVVLLGKTIDRRILIEVQVAAGTLVDARRTDLNQLFLNLLINARDTLIEKMESGTVNPGWQPSIRIAVSVHKTAPKPDLKAEAWWKLSFADNGMGMSAAVRERVFEPFFTTKEVGRGTGLGLATVWHVVQAEQGHIEIESTVGEGTTFQVFLPAMQDESGTARLSLGGVAPGAVSANEVVGGRRLLLVEDQPDVAESVMALLKLEDYAVHAIADGAEALNLIQTHPAQFDVIITDLNLPGLRGTELVEKLRANGFSGPLIAFSGRISAEDEARLKKVRVTAILPKPFEAKDLLALLRA
jgi:two-component system, cell cycle sensor histidine kinase and response regulator CckA